MKILGTDPREYGLPNQNRKALVNMTKYSHELALRHCQSKSA